MNYSSSFPSPSPTASPFCKAWQSHPTYCRVIFVGRTASAALSLVGCLFMIFIICLFKKYQFFVQRLILWLSTAALVDTIGYLMIPEVIKPNGYCTFMAFWQEYMDWSVLLWVCCITFNLYWTVLKLKKTNRLEWVYHLICWGLSLAIACIPFLNDSYGAATIMCWILPEHNVMRFAIWYVPFFILLSACISAYLYIMVIINRRSRVWSGSYNPETGRNLMLLKEDVKPLRFYPLAYISLNVFPFINRVQNAVEGGSSTHPIFILSFLAIISDTLQGFLIAVIYGLDKDTLYKLTFPHIKMAIRQRMGYNLIGEYPAQARPLTVTTGDHNSDIESEDSQ